MEHFEKWGVFYLGRHYDLPNKKPAEGLLLYDAKDLVTHGICVGMTGSGKTGLCVALLEEAALDGIPAIIIDPKGDMTNLLLTFPGLTPDEFRPWINEDDAQRKSMTPEEYAIQQSELWTKGLASWGQDGERIQQLRQSADFTIYTPGSTAGTPVSILKSFAAPPDAIIDDSELLQERVGGTAASLLGLLGIDADPIRSREHILLSSILSSAWRQQIDMDLSTLIQQIQSPPFQQIGVMSLESFFPAKDRFQLALQLNNLLASPGFAAWMEGEPLDISRLLFTESGKPRHSIFSIAHLSDAERMFFVALLLNQILSWTRIQSGTTSLRAIVYMDEIFGFFPPVANPPSKGPLMALLKQARAFGVGIMLTTQNPVDLDYKGLSNIGTWFIGRLQTERDKMKIMEGLQGAAVSQQAVFDRRKMEETLSALGNRVFLMHNVHDDGPSIFETRWCMSYLRGPLTRQQIRLLAKGTNPAGNPAPTISGKTMSALTVPPVLPPDIQQYFIQPNASVAPGTDLEYRAALTGWATIQFSDRKANLSQSAEKIYWTDFPATGTPPAWQSNQTLLIPRAEWSTSPDERISFTSLPDQATLSRMYSQWGRDLADWIYRNESLPLFMNPTWRIFSEPGEPEREFRIRLQQKARESRDEAMEALRKKFNPKMASLEERIRKSEQALEREKDQAKQQSMQTAIHMGTTLLSSFLGRKSVNATNLGKVSTTARSASRIMKEKEDIRRSQDTMETYQRQLSDLEAEFKMEADRLGIDLDPMLVPIESYWVRPAKKDVAVQQMALIWLPYTIDLRGDRTVAWS